MLLSRVLLAGPLELPLVSPATDEAATDAETFELSRGRVTACFSVDTAHRRNRHRRRHRQPARRRLHGAR